MQFDMVARYGGRPTMPGLECQKLTADNRFFKIHKKLKMVIEKYAF
jgi:hypothetical protein